MLNRMKEKLEKDEEQSAGVKLLVRRHIVDGAETPSIAQHFLFTRVGKDILLEAGYFDLVELKSVLDSAGPGGSAEVQLYISNRVMVGVKTLRQLRDATEQILNGLETESEEASDDSY